MEKSEKNKAIAEILGFKQYEIKVNGNKNAMMAWSYPDEYKYLSCATPMWDCPDFIQLIEDRRQIKKIIQGWEL